MRNTVTLNGISSSTIQGLLIQELPPISKPMIRTNIEEIDGKDGDIVTKLGYSAYDKEVSIGLYGNFDINQVIAFFNTEGEVIFSNEPDKYYRYKILEQIDFERLIRFRTATVTFHVQPFKYEVNEDPIEENSNIEEDSVPYAFRKSPYGDRKFNEIHGGTIAWNQLVSNSTFPIAHSENGITNTWADGTMTIVGTASTASWIYVQRANGNNIAPDDHVYLVITTNVPNDVRFGMLIDNGSFVYGADGQNTVLMKNTVGIRAINFRHPANVAYNYSTKPQLFDLTQMFGSAIADYIYSLEQSNAGAGVAWFKSLFPKPYYAYNAGELIFVSGLSAHKMTGFNQWDEEWEVGGMTINGQPSTSTNEMRCKNYIPAFPNTQYCFTVPVWGVIYQYDADKNFLLRTPLIGGDRPPLFTTLANTAYIKFFLQSIYGTTYKNDICINISGERNGQYEPYESHSYALDSSLTLRGVPKLNSSNEMYFDGDVYKSDGTVERRCGVRVLDGSETWAWDSNNSLAYTIVNDLIKVDAVSQHYPATINDNAELYDKSWAGRAEAEPSIGPYYGQPRLYMRGSSITSANDAKAYFANKPTNVVYLLDSPTTESAEPYVNPQICNEYGTEEYVSAEQNGVTMIVGHNTEYSSQISATIINKGNYISKPKITVYGTGTVGVYLNGVQAFSIDMDGSDYITIDAEKMEAYQGDILKNRKVTGDYSNFIFNVGENILSVSGYVTNLELRNYSRWL